MQQSESIIKIAPALLKAQKNIEDAIKDSTNPHYKSSYANINAVMEACKPALNAEGVVLLQPIVNLEGKRYVRTLLLHESGEYLSSDTEIVVKEQNNPQALGSAISYARRYGLQAFVAVVSSEDDDAENATGRQKETSFSKEKKDPEAEKSKLFRSPKGGNL